MADLHKLTVQEATNTLAQRKVIRVTPTLDAGTAYAQHDVLFNTAHQKETLNH